MVISTARRTEADEDREPVPILTPAVFLILLALADGESHGYGIMQDVERFTNGETRLGPGTLYRSIQRMLVDGLVEELAGLAPVEVELRDQRLEIVIGGQPQTIPSQLPQGHRRLERLSTRIWPAFPPGGRPQPAACPSTGRRLGGR